ncbi:RlmE family RNA methyltransferase [Candidatus Bathyarchaeota archaeon]|nr:RlmE family RNA methyltransferase [Candidatus Bathyarchaeota archaeon]
MVKKSKLWLEKRHKDQFHKLASKLGYRSRAAFKLLQIAEKHPLLKKGDKVLDLGAAPGGWIQAAEKIIGDKGFIYAIDVKPIQPLNLNNVKTEVLDLTSEHVASKIFDLTKGKVDVVLSDASPKFSGVLELDAYRQYYLAKKSLEIAEKTLKKGGNFLVKMLQSKELKAFKEELKIKFEKVKLIKPLASRKESSEIYVLCLNFTG